MYSNPIKSIANGLANSVVAAVSCYSTIIGREFAYAKAVNNSQFLPKGSIPRIMNSVFKIGSISPNRITLFAAAAATALTAALKIHENFIERTNLSTQDALLDTLLFSAFAGLSTFLSIKIANRIEGQSQFPTLMLAAGLNATFFAASFLSPELLSENF